MTDNTDQGGLVNDSVGSKSKDTKSLPFESDSQPLAPAEVIFHMLDEATRRTTPQGGVEFGQLSNGTMFHHKSLDQRINEYIERLLGDKVNDLQPFDVPSQDKGHSEAQS